ncbi:hypothetical protein EYV94_27370 [Puteibacter caeruleilacunae]|nr:hypothetical protein EYV94_27370 [Puteibacter caeruleilacunae]
MKNIIFIGLIFSILNLCCPHKALTAYFQDNKTENNPIGFVFIDFSRITNQEEAVSVLDQNGDTILYLQNRVISLHGIDYAVYDEEHLYKKLVDAEVFEPEYGFFILRCYEITDQFYKVELNEKVALVSKDVTSKSIQFKNVEKYIMESYPMPTQQNPIRVSPDEDADEVNDFDKWTYLPVEIDGDWVKVVDDKDCYSGEAPSSIDIKGWIRWRKDGKFILKVAHTC